MRQWITPRSLMLHVAFIVIASGCLAAGWWQVHRAEQGNTLSYLYAVEWPAFAVVAGIGWWQMFHDTPADIAARKEHQAKMRAASVAVVARTLPRSARAITVGSAEAPAASLPAGSKRAAIPARGSAPSGGSPVGGTPSGGTPSGGPSMELLPLDGDDMDTVLLQAEDGDADTDPLAEYNRYLATLALHGKAKTWRNPRGI